MAEVIEVSDNAGSCDEIDTKTIALDEFFDNQASIKSVFTCSINNRHQNDAWRGSGGVFIVNFEHILHLVLVFILLTLTIFHTLLSCFYC